MSDIRREIGDDEYDKKIRRLFTLIVDDPTTQYHDINAVWGKFNEIFMVFGSLVTYKEVWKDYFRQSLQEMYDDNVQYLEFRGVLPEVDWHVTETIMKNLLIFANSQTYDLEGKKYGPVETCQIYVDVLKEFKSSHKDFVGAKFIYAPIRAANDEMFNTYLPIMLKLQRNFPNFIAGFDLVGQEDKGTISFASQLS